MLVVLIILLLDNLGLLSMIQHRFVFLLDIFLTRCLTFSFSSTTLLDVRHFGLTLTRLSVVLSDSRAIGAAIQIIFFTSIFCIDLIVAVDLFSGTKSS